MNFEMDGRSSIVFFTFLCELCKKSCELFDYKPNWNQDLEDLEASSQVVSEYFCWNEKSRKSVKPGNPEKPARNVSATINKMVYIPARRIGTYI